MIHTENTVRTLQAVAMTVGIAVFLWSTGLPTLFRHADAASITNASDTLSSSAPGLGSNHTIAFETENGLIIGGQITLTFPTAVNEFVLNSIGVEDVDILVDGTSSTTALTSGAATWGVSTTTSSITFTTPTDMGVASATPIVIRVGNHAVTSGTGNTQITNPTVSTSYSIDIGGTMTDSGEVVVAIVNQVQVSASVAASLTFTVTGVAGGATVNGSPTTTVGATTATTLPFGTLPIDESLTLGHHLAVSTNAANGFIVTVEQTGELQSTTGETIDGFIDGAYTTTPAAWQSPAGLIANTDTYGHWAVTSDDFVTGRSSEFSSNTWVSGSTTPVIIMGHTDPADGITSGQGSTTVGYQIQITALQEASDDYTTTLRYIATPTF